MTRAARIGIVTMHSPEIMSYANTTSLVNQEYAERHGYGFHILNHTDYDFAFWIDADAMFYDHSRRIEDVLQVQDPTDGATFLIRNSEWARRFLLEMYFYPPCIQYCLTLAYNANLLNVREKTLILPTPTLNHHRIPALGLQRQLFIWHLAGRSTKQRASHMKLVYEDYGSKFQERRMSDIAFEPSTSPLGLNEWRLTLICLTLKLALETPKWRTLEQFLGGF
eukprot:g31144.t2